MSLARLLSEALVAADPPRTGDVLAVGLPLLRELDECHRRGLVGLRSGIEGVNYDGVRLALTNTDGHEPSAAPIVDQLNPFQPRPAIRVTARFEHDLTDDSTGVHRSADVFDPIDADDDRPRRPMFVVGYRAWEQLHGQHDVLTDIHLAGLMLTSFALGLDLALPVATHELALASRHLLRLNPVLHPVVGNVLSEMIQPDRHARPGTLVDVIARLEHHRELPADLDLSGAYQSTDPTAGGVHWRGGVLATLRERVFDTTRRNRALYFKPSAATVSLTEASVPLLLDVERIEPGDLLTWTGTTVETFRKGKPVDLERWCRFDEAPHLAPGLENLIATERKIRAEHGYGRLRLIIAFLRWVDPDNAEEIHSPLLTMPVDLTRKKGLTSRYLVQIEPEAEVNPVLRHVLAARFGIRLPERIDSDSASIASFIDELETAVRRSDPGLTIDIVDAPRINLIRRRAQLRVDAYLRRRAQAQATSGRWRRNDYSYASDDWRPLGLTLYRRFVQPSELPLRTLAGAAPTRPPAASLTHDQDPPPPGTRARDFYTTQTSDISRQRWEVDLCAVTLASLGSRRSTLARDYDELLERAAAEQTTVETATDEAPGQPASPFDAMFSPTHTRRGMPTVAPISLDQMLVLPADATQAQAIRHALAGTSFIVQGPPGTGKSQTITNLIAALVADGKRVLFVCEKRAALDVVAHRLDQVGLGSLVATIHDAELDRKTFIGELGATYDDWLAETTDQPEARRNELLDELAVLLGPLESSFADLHVPRHGPHSIADLIERAVVLRSNRVVAGDSSTDLIEAADWLAARPALDATRAGLVAAGLDPRLGRHFVLRTAPRFVATGNPLQTVPELGRTIRSAADALEAALPPGLGLAAIRLADLDIVTRPGDMLEQILVHQTQDLLDPASAVHAQLQAARDQQHRSIQAAAALEAVPDRWREMLSADDARNALTVADESEHSFFRLLNGRWRAVQRLVRANYLFDRHAVEPSITQVLTELVQWHDAQQALLDNRQRLIERFGTADADGLLDFVQAAAPNVVAAHLLRPGTNVPLAPLPDAATTLQSAATTLRSAATRLCELGPQLLFAEQSSIADLRTIATGLDTMSVAHERALLAWAHLASAPLPVLHAALSELDDDADGHHLDRTELAVLERTLEAAHAAGRLETMTSTQLDDAVERILAGYRTLLSTNASVVHARARRRFSDHVTFSDASMAGRSADDKEFKRSYAAGRRLLEREFKKRMRFRPIRELASGDSGTVVRDLKPVWLMSPLSVSTTLPLDQDQFDVVVFDEASQIPVEDAVPTLFRARQAIIVGDRMQLPPTRFFSSHADADDDALLVDDEGQGLSVSMDADSFLTQADVSFDSLMLNWHYRSRSESLISYSNSAFYGGRLATVPDRTFAANRRAGLAASAPEDARSNLVAALERPISFHHITNGCYAARRNEAEADYVAELVRSLLRSGDERTIGVAAFSEAQQHAIEDALDELAIADPTFGLALEREMQRVEHGEFVGLFVKNLENVQGDERDIIIMSVCYGPGPDGTMRMNFGPINQSGGERRLNVIFSRSKQHMMIVSTITGAQITNTHNDGAANLARFLTYAEAESRGDHDASTAALVALDAVPGSTRREEQTSAVASSIAGALTERGWRVDLDVGRSVFTIDAAIRGDDRYVLGIMIDPGNGSTSALARLVADAGVLAAFDWPITRIFISEWLHTPTQVIDRIDRQLRTLMR